LSPDKPPDGFTHANGLPAVPLVLGVVGHRDPRAADIEVLRQKLVELFQQFKKAYPHTPLVLLSSLAEGADQLAAQVALENDVFVRAPLPFPKEIFRASTSFSTGEARTTLDQQLADPCVEALVAPLPEGTAPSGVDWQAVAADQANAANRDLRRVCYANAGGYIVRHCHALIALWDGNEGDPARPSGTAEYVAFKLQGKAPAYYPWANAEPLGFRGERGLVYVIHTPRASSKPDDPRLKIPPGEVNLLLPANKQPLERLIPLRPLARSVRLWLWLLRRVTGWLPWKHGVSAEGKAELWQFQETCQAVADFNRDVLSTPDVDSLRKRLDEIPNVLPADFRSSDQYRRWLTRLSGVREAAGHLSGQLKPKLDKTQLVVFGMLGLSVALFHVYAHWFTIDTSIAHAVHQPVWLWLFLGSLLAAVLIVWFGRRSRLDERRLDYRALAEALRVRRAWAIAGIGKSVADSYLGQLRSEMSWARRALQHVCPPSSVWAAQFAGLTAGQQRERLEMVKQDWVKEQIEQFKKGHKREERWASGLRKTGFALAVMGWLWIPLLLLAGSGASPRSGVAEEKPAAAADKPSADGPDHSSEHARAHRASAAQPEHWWLLASGLLVIVGGLCVALCELRSHEALANQYQRMRVVFEGGRNELERRLAGSDIPDAQAVLKALGQEAIAEHAQWLILRRARLLELHIGG
jgi:hypothetical protein